MDYIKKLEEAKRLYETANADQKYVLESLFPEIRESDDEKIRKEIIKFLELPHPQFVGKRHQEDWLAWLEKQGDKLQKTSIWKHWKDGIAGNGEGEPIYLVKNGNTYSLNSCLGYECDYIELSELDKLMLENTWKPSEEQIEILDMVLTNESMDDNIARILRELREQLKKLREE